MSKLIGPLMSLGARGSVGKTLTYAKWRGISYVRQLVIPANPNTTGQQLSRNVFRTLTQMWKVAGNSLRAPFDAFAAGRPFLGSNQWIKSNVLGVRGEVDFNNFVASPGAGGGLPMISCVASQGSGSGEIDVTITEPVLPSGWTITRAVAVAFPDQDPAVAFVGPMDIDQDVATPFVVVLTGMGSAVACQGAGFLEYVKPNGDTAYSVGITSQATSGV